jgi:hypothetical protein
VNAPNPAGDDDLVVVNGIDIETGQYAFTPRTIEDLARRLVNHPRPRALDHTDELFPPCSGFDSGLIH